MLVYINSQMRFINKPVKPVILIYGSSEESNKEISKILKEHSFHIQTISEISELPDIIKAMRPAIIIIGGRCRPDIRLMIRYFVREINNAILFSEPGIEFMNSTDAVIKDVLYKMKHSTCKPLYTQAV